MLRTQTDPRDTLDAATRAALATAVVRPVRGPLPREHASVRTVDPRAVVRSRAWLTAAFLTALPALSGCPSSTPPAPDVASDAAVDASIDGAADNAVTVSNTERRGFASGTPVEVPVPGPTPTRVAAIVTVNGAVQTIAGTLRDSVAVLAGVPGGPYVLEVRAPPPADFPNDLPTVLQFPVNGARRVRLGGDYWGRPNTVALAPTTALALSVTTPSPLAEGDMLTWVSLRSYFYRAVFYFPTATSQMNVPSVGATSTNAWTIPGSDLLAFQGDGASGLPSAAAGDDLTVIHGHDETITRAGDPRDPWNSFSLHRNVGVLTVPNAMFANGTANAVTGALTAPTGAESTALDFRGSSFAAIRAAAGYPAGAVNTTVEISLLQDVGTGPGFLASAAVTSWRLASSGVPIPANPTCYPDAGGLCPDPSCPVLCDSTVTSFRDPGDLSYTVVAPVVYPTGLRPLFSVIYSFSRMWSNPTTGALSAQQASATILRPRAAQTGPLTMEQGPVSNLRIGGMSLPWDRNTAGLGLTPTITFAPPALGTPEYYAVEVIELTPDESASGGDAGTGLAPRRPARDAAVLNTQATSLQIPANVLQAGRYYYVRVRAVRDGRDFSNPSLAPADSALSTGVFSPVFSP